MRAAARSPSRHFVLGGARSGKSAYAERLAADQPFPVTYMATAAWDARDDEFGARIAQHRERRPAHWQLCEADEDLAGAVIRADRAGGLILLDCLTLWLTRLLCPADGDAPFAAWRAKLAEFDQALQYLKGDIVIVSNEIGMGVVPMGALTRLYVDELGRLNQRVAACCEDVTLCVAGIPMVVKQAKNQMGSA
jgi:adenosylcobinamide kinase/adenosylcobinamide-phosphate guanylyltransferase